MSKYKIILADPSWAYNDKGVRGGTKKHYQDLSLEDIKSLPVGRISDEDSVLFLWATFPLIQEALDVIKSWEFTYKGVGFTWIKTNPKSGTLFWGCGHRTRANAEVCLIATKGNLKVVDRGVHSVVIAPNTKHSRKPEEVQDRIERLYGDVSRIELFARRTRDGWTCIGNEINGKDIRDECIKFI